MEKSMILQIIPATGWGAMYKGESGAALDPIVCFALVEEIHDGEISRRIRPMVADPSGIEFVDEASNFAGVAYGPNNLQVG